MLKSLLISTVTALVFFGGVLSYEAVSYSGSAAQVSLLNMSDLSVQTEIVPEYDFTIERLSGEALSEDYWVLNENGEILIWEDYEDLSTEDAKDYLFYPDNN